MKPRYTQRNPCFHPCNPCLNYQLSLINYQLFKIMNTTTQPQPDKKPQNTWDIILKIIIAVAGAISGIIGANAMNL